MGQNPADVELSLAGQWGHRHGAAPGGSPAPGVVLPHALRVTCSKEWVKVWVAAPQFSSVLNRVSRI